MTRCTKADCTDAACTGEHWEPETPKVVPAIAANALPPVPVYAPPVPAAEESRRGESDAVVPAYTGPDLRAEVSTDTPVRTLFDVGAVEGGSSHRPVAERESEEVAPVGRTVEEPRVVGAKRPVKKGFAQAFRDTIKGKSSSKKGKGKKKGK